MLLTLRAHATCLETFPPQKKMTLLCFGAERINPGAAILLGALVQHTEKYRWRHVGCVQTHTPVFLQC